MSYIVRHKVAAGVGLVIGKDRSLSTDGYFYCDSGFENAQKFEALEDARAAIAARRETNADFWHVFEVTFGIKWYDEGKPPSEDSPDSRRIYYARAKNEGPWIESRKDAHRFATKAEAIARRDVTWLRQWVNHDGKKHGAKIVRFLRKVRT